jgi:hypothetical protein
MLVQRVLSAVIHEHGSATVDLADLAVFHSVDAGIAQVSTVDPAAVAVHHDGGPVLTCRRHSTVTSMPDRSGARTTTRVNRAWVTDALTVTDALNKAHPLAGRVELNLTPAGLSLAATDGHSLARLAGDEAGGPITTAVVRRDFLATARTLLLQDPDATSDGELLFTTDWVILQTASGDRIACRRLERESDSQAPVCAALQQMATPAKQAPSWRLPRARLAPALKRASGPRAARVTLDVTASAVTLHSDDGAGRRLRETIPLLDSAGIPEEGLRFSLDAAAISRSVDALHPSGHVETRVVLAHKTVRMVVMTGATNAAIAVAAGAP